MSLYKTIEKIVLTSEIDDRILKQQVLLLAVEDCKVELNNFVVDCCEHCDFVAEKVQIEVSVKISADELHLYKYCIDVA